MFAETASGESALTTTVLSIMQACIVNHLSACKIFDVEAAGEVSGMTLGFGGRCLSLAVACLDSRLFIFL